MTDIRKIFNLEEIMSERAIKERELINEFIGRQNHTFDVVKELLELGPESVGQLAYTLISQTRDMAPNDPACRMTVALAASLLVVQANADLDKAEAMD
jgi:hypothetical protein